MSAGRLQPTQKAYLPYQDCLNDPLSKWQLNELQWPGFRGSRERGGLRPLGTKIIPSPPQVTGMTGQTEEIFLLMPIYNQSHLKAPCLMKVKEGREEWLGARVGGERVG